MRPQDVIAPHPPPPRFMRKKRKMQLQTIDIKKNSLSGYGQAFEALVLLSSLVIVLLLNVLVELVEVLAGGSYFLLELLLWGC